MRKENLLVIYAKEPAPGSVKTRLAKDVGHRAAAVLYALMLKYVLKKVASPHYDIQISKTPESREAFFKEHFSCAVVKNQSEGDLGKRMSNTFQAAFAEKYRKICIIGTDCPDVSSIEIENAFHLLGKYELVLGPSSDGGYYLIALSSFYPELFEGISWSTGSVYSETIEKARFLYIGYASLAVEADIDDICDLEEYIINHQGTKLAAAFEKVLRDNR